MKRTIFILSFLFPVLSTAKDWPGYRGPIGMGVIQAKAKPPLHWDAKTGGNILWQVPLPLGDGTVEHVATVQEPWPESTALTMKGWFMNSTQKRMKKIRLDSFLY